MLSRVSSRSKMQDQESGEKRERNSALSDIHKIKWK